MNQIPTTGSEARPTSPRRWARIARALLAVVAVTALSTWLARDLPRRWLEGWLSSALEADVRLERLRFDGLQHFVLQGLEVRDVRWESRLERLTIARMEVRAPLREALAGRYDFLLADGIELRLAPPSRAARPGPVAGVRIAELELHRGRLTVASPAGDAEIEFGATLADWGGEPTGRVFLESRRLGLPPLLDVFARPAGGPSMDVFSAEDSLAEDVRIDLDLGPDLEAWRLVAGGSRLRVAYEGRELVLERPALEAKAAGGDTGDAVRISFRSVVPGVEDTTLDAALDPDTFALRWGRAELRGIQLGALFERGAVLPGGWAVAGRGDLSVHTDDGASFAYAFDTEIARLELSLAEARVHAEGGRAGLRGSWDGSVGSVETHPLAYEFDATFDTLRVTAGTSGFSAEGSALSSRGTLDPGWNGPVQARLTLPVGRGPDPHGPSPGELFPLDVELAGELTLDGGPAFAGTTELASPAFGRVRIRGRTDLARGEPRARWRWQWSDAPELPALLATAAGLGLAPPTVGFEIAGRPSATGRLDGPLADPALSCDLRVRGLELATTAGSELRDAGGFRLDGGRARAQLSRRAGDASRVRVAGLAIEGRATHAGGAGSAARVFSSGLALAADGSLDARLGALDLVAGRIDIDGLGGVALAGRREPDGSARVEARFDPIELSRIRELSRRWVADDPLPDFAVSGSVTSRVEARRTAAGLWLTQGRLDLSAAGLGSADGARVLEGADAHAEVRLSSRVGGDIEGEATIALNGPVLLWGTLFGDFSRLPSVVRLQARRDAGRWESSAVWALPHGVEIHGRLAATPAPHRRIDYSGSVAMPDLGAVLDHYVRTPFEGSVERIDTLGAAGQLGIELTGSIDGTRRSIEGAVRAANASFSGVDGATRIEGLALDLPIALSWQDEPDGGRKPEPGVERSGSLGYQALRLGGLEFPALDTGLTVVGDTIRLDRPLDLAVLEGNVQLQGVALADWTLPERHLRFSLRLDGLSLAALTRALDTIPLDGSLSGAFPAVRLTPERLQVDGGGTIELFGGRVSVYDISGQNVLSRFPRLRFSARLEDIHLLEVTRTFDFGEVYGVVSGEIRDCELFGGAPVRCEASLGSVATRGVPQKISVKAIRNISILGSGPKVGILDRGLQKFLDTYTYSRLGFTMTLNQDRFLLRGTERRGTRELFVKGRLPFRIDIVNAAPGQTVSFQTMMQRLGNLQVAGPERKEGKQRSDRAGSEPPVAPDGRAPVH